jgi:hypothetical protein
LALCLKRLFDEWVRILLRSFAKLSDRNRLLFRPFTWDQDGIMEIYCYKKYEGEDALETLRIATEENLTYYGASYVQAAIKKFHTCYR